MTSCEMKAAVSPCYKSYLKFVIAILLSVPLPYVAGSSRDLQFRSPNAGQGSPTPHANKDSLEKFSKDVGTVLHVLKAFEYGSDPSIPDVYRNPIYDREDWWKRHVSRWRYVRYLADFPFKSRLLRRTLPQMTVLFFWCCIAIRLSSSDQLVAKLHIGLTPMSLVSTFVAALLTLRGNQGLSRLQEARRVIGQVCLHTREMSQLIGTGIFPHDEEMGLLAARHVTIFCWTLKAHLQGLTDENSIVATMLPNPTDAYYITNYMRKPPVAILMRLRQIFSKLASEKKIDPTTMKALVQTMYRMNEALMTAERVRISPIPPLYTTHTTRLLIFYLFWLPFALYGTLKNGAATLMITMVVGYAMLGLDEISHILEIPFRFMPLRQLSKISMIEAADALVYRPPPLNGTAAAHPPSNPSYWYREQQKHGESAKRRIVTD